MCPRGVGHLFYCWEWSLKQRKRKKEGMFWIYSGESSRQKRLLWACCEKLECFPPGFPERFVCNVVDTFYHNNANVIHHYFLKIISWLQFLWLHTHTSRIRHAVLWIHWALFRKFKESACVWECVLRDLSAVTWDAWSIFALQKIIL